jgi:hypothetical protein
MSRSRRDRTRWWPATRWREASAPGSFDAPGGLELIRFVGEEIDEDSRQPIGAFQLAARLSRSGELEGHNARLLERARRWFNEHLPRPRRFSHHREGWRRAASGRHLREPIAISWFKPDAGAHLAEMGKLVNVLRAYDIVVHELRSRRPGYVTYEDRFQVVAVPFTGDPLAERPSGGG